MKWSELEKYLKEHGCRQISEGGRHERWLGVNGKTFPFERHGSKEAGKGIVNKILKQAGLK